MLWSWTRAWLLHTWAQGMLGPTDGVDVVLWRKSSFPCINHSCRTQLPMLMLVRRLFWGVCTTASPSSYRNCRCFGSLLDHHAGLAANPFMTATSNSRWKRYSNDTRTIPSCFFSTLNELQEEIFNNVVPNVEGWHGRWQMDRIRHRWCWSIGASGERIFLSLIV